MSCPVSSPTGVPKSVQGAAHREVPLPGETPPVCGFPFPSPPGGNSQGGLRAQSLSTGCHTPSADPVRKRLMSRNWHLIRGGQSHPKLLLSKLSDTSESLQSASAPDVQNVKVAWLIPTEGFSFEYNDFPQTALWFFSIHSLPLSSLLAFSSDECPV